MLIKFDPMSEFAIKYIPNIIHPVPHLYTKLRTKCHSSLANTNRGTNLIKILQFQISHRNINNVRD